MTLSLALLRRLALGLPLVVLPGATGILLTATGCGTCASQRWSGTLSAEQLARFSSSTPSSETCQLTCDEILALQNEAGSGDAVMDGSLSCDRDGSTLVCTQHGRCIGGRAPQGLVAPKASRGGIASLFGEMAHLETAAIPAFEELAEELALHGAPRSMQRAARRGMADERRHARAVSGLARRYGGVVPDVVRTERTPRTLFEMAADNAFEGCVREAYGALEAAHQAVHAADPVVRGVFESIAREEAQHALLSFELDAWARTRLSAREGRALTELRREGAARLGAELHSERGREVRVLAGMPSATRANDLIALIA